MSASCLVFALLCLILVAFVQTAPQGRITGGSEAFEGQFPYQVSLRKYDVHTCGGSIISKNYILTAAHCVISKKNGDTHVSKPEEIKIQAGSTNRTRGGVVVPVASIIVHEKYGFNMNDLALLKLAQPLNFSETVKSIPLPTADKPVGGQLIISGWGRLATGAERPDKLQWAVVNGISDGECEKRVQISSERLMCVSHPVSVGPCNGDSGGPATHNGELVGVAGFIIKGCGTKKPDVFANVFYYLPWIKEHSDV